MKTTGMTVALLLAVASVSAYAQAGGNTPERRPTSSAQGTVGPTQPSSAGGSGTNKLRKGNGTTFSESGSGPVGSQSTGTTSGQRRKGKAVNQQASGVPASGSASTSRASKPNRNQ